MSKYKKFPNTYNSDTTRVKIHGQRILGFKRVRAICNSRLFIELWNDNSLYAFKDVSIMTNKPELTK